MFVEVLVKPVVVELVVAEPVVAEPVVAELVEASKRPQEKANEGGGFDKLSNRGLSISEN